MDDLSFAGHTDYGLADLLRSRIRERDQADGKNSVLHASLVHEVSRVERALAIRNAREQARIDAEAGSPQPGDVHLAELLDEVQRLRSERDADKRIAAEIQTEIERMTKLLEHAEMAREVASEQSALDRERAADVVRRVVRERVASVEGWSGFSEGSIGRMIGDIAEHCADLLATPAVQLSAEDVEAIRLWRHRADTTDGQQAVDPAVDPAAVRRAAAALDAIDRLLAAHGAKP